MSYNLNTKLAGFLTRLEVAGLTRSFDGPLAPYSYDRVDATQEIADAIRRGLAAHGRKPA
nr:ELM1/GtrOC1 family putative glycosyltransferase [Marinicella sp. W31]MDC2877153.1 ELM1/GtrOC1 family putative glycosyltransferase [Marinicella sp. W31]